MKNLKTYDKVQMRKKEVCEYCGFTTQTIVIQVTFQNTSKVSTFLTDSHNILRLFELSFGVSEFVSFISFRLNSISHELDIKL